MKFLTKIISSFIGRILGMYVKKQLENDKDLMKNVKDADARVEELKDIVKRMKERGNTVPDFLKPYDNEE